MGKKKPENKKKPVYSKFITHTNILIWKCVLQRRRRWILLLVETVFALLLFVLAVLISKPVFLTPIQSEPKPPLGSREVLGSLRKDTILGYAPNDVPYIKLIMDRAATLLGHENVWTAMTEYELNQMLYNKSRGVPLKRPITWIIWKPRVGNIWSLSIRSTELARFLSRSGEGATHNPHLQAGFLAVQLAISQAIIEHVADKPKYEVTLVAMPISPLMEETRVKRALSGILLCFTLALLPPVIETEALVITESVSRFKRSLRLRNVEYTSMYVSWLIYGYLTCLPIWGLATITLILIFRWIYVIEALMIVMAYSSVMIMIAQLMGMFHKKAVIACVWSSLFTLLQTYLSDLLVHHHYDRVHIALNFFLDIVFPPMGLVHAFNKFALLRTDDEEVEASTSTLLYMVASWTVINMLYFGILMMLQRTVGQNRAIGGQVTWKSVIFQKAEDRDELHGAEIPTGSERGKVQEVDEFVAKAISFRDVCKSIMGVPVLRNITFDIYRGEYSMLFAERIQTSMMGTLQDLITGLTMADSGSITVLGKKLVLGTDVLATPQMMGYCHRSEALIEDLTVQEHFTLYSQICLWKYPKISVREYSLIRTERLLLECDLENVKNERVRNLNVYYKAQLCWAIAMLLEPRIVILPHFVDCRQYANVIHDKIMQYKKSLTIVSFIYTSMELEHSDRIFVFDSKILVFGGTPAYMFFRFGREYRAHITLKSNITDEKVQAILTRAQQAGATFRSHLGCLLILRVPTSPSSSVAELVKDLTEHTHTYGIRSFNISVPDSEEVCKRAISDCRTLGHLPVPLKCKEALTHFSQNVKWERQTKSFSLHFGHVFWKFCVFHSRHKKLFGFSFVLAVLAGLLVGFTLSEMMLTVDPTNAVPRGDWQILSVEFLNIPTTLVLRAGNTPTSRSVASGYVFSDTNATMKQTQYVEYTALASSESLTEYLVTRAIDSPQIYVFRYAYGMDVSTDKNGKIMVQALYSALHYDNAAAARSLARVHMALIRHYTGQMDATILISDDPLMLDLSPWMKSLGDPNLMIQFMFILTITHITILPSLEYGLVRHVQKHAIGFSPFRYWLSLYICDLLLFWLQTAVISILLVFIIHQRVPSSQLQLIDLLIFPIILTLYGVGCVPQAYIFSLGPRVALNAMAFVIVNLLFGETTLIAKIFYGDVYNYVMNFMTLSPQFNMAYAYWKIEQLFMYNNECYLFEEMNLCSQNAFHKCCKKCGVLQECFSHKSYFDKETGIIVEIASMVVIALFYTLLLLLIEYRIFLRMWHFATSALEEAGMPDMPTPAPGYTTEKHKAIEKKIQINKSDRLGNKINPFGEYLLACSLTKREENIYKVHNVYFGIGKGEILAVCGLEKHGRTLLCEILAGYRYPSVGNVSSMSKYKLISNPHKYCQQVAISCEMPTLPQWMTVQEALSLIAALRGVPKNFIHEEVTKVMEVLELNTYADVYICDMSEIDHTRLHFAAAIIGAPPVIVLDDITAYQEVSVRQAMYILLTMFKNRGHAICICSSIIESHLPMGSRIAIMVDGTFHDMETCENLVEQYSEAGYTVVVHLKDDVDINAMFAKYFKVFKINDTAAVLANIQVQDQGLTWANIFAKMEILKAENQEVYSYIVTTVPLDYIFNSLITSGPGIPTSKYLWSWKWLNKLMSVTPEIRPRPAAERRLIPLKCKYNITKLYTLPWSVMFYR